MKKNKMMRLASVLLVCVLLTTSVISGTFAKYVTSDSASDTARVAKWGITVLASGDLFGTDYTTNAAGTNQNMIQAATSTNVHSSDTSNVVAPGTKNAEGFKVSIAGKPEVAYQITATDNGVTTEEIFLAAGTYGVMIKATGLNAATDVTGYYTLSGTTYTAATGTWDSGKEYYKLVDTVTLAATYYPITWAVANTGNATAIAATRLGDIMTAMQTGIVAGTHDAGSDSAASYKLTWEWPFSVSDEQDKQDTILGDLAAQAAGIGHEGKVVKLDSGNYTSNLTPGTDYNLDIAFGIKVTVTQVD